MEQAASLARQAASLALDESAARDALNQATEFVVGLPSFFQMALLLLILLPILTVLAWCVMWIVDKAANLLSR